MTDIPQFQKLFKRTVAGNVQEWQISVESGPAGSGIIVTTYGLQDGQQQTIREQIVVGTNVGKRNETTPLQQACLNAKSKWEKQLTRRCYGLTVEASGQSRAEAPMLAQDYAKHLKAIQWDTAYAQPKLDGFRCLARCQDGKVTLWSREGKPIETMGHIVEQLSHILKEDDVLDGELYLPGTAFQKIASRIKKQQAESAQIQYHVYDTMLDVPFIDRYQQIPAKLRRLPSGLIVPVETQLVKDLDSLLRFQVGCIEQGFEGAMLRYGTEGYDAGKRSKYLLKVKTFKDAEFVITGAREGRGTHAGMAIFLCQTDTGAEFEVLAHGTHDEKRAAWANWQNYVGKKLTVKFHDWTTSEQPLPRFPVALRFAERV